MAEQTVDAGAVPRSGDWIGALVRLPSYITGEGAPYRPVAVMWMEPESGCVVQAEIVRPDEALRRAAELFAAATRRPLTGEPRIPRRLRVVDEELAGALRGQIGDVELVVGPAPEIDQLAAMLRDRMEQDDEQDEDGLTFVGPDMTDADVAQFFRAAARLYRARPWDFAPQDGFFGVRCELLGIDAGALCVVGQGGDSFGCLLCRSAADASAYLAAAEARMQGRESVLPEHVMFSYDDRKTLGPVLAREVKERGWEVAGPRAYPTAVVVDSDLVTRGLTRRELLGLTAIVDTLAVVVESEPELETLWDAGPARAWSAVVATGLGPVPVELRAPLHVEGGGPASENPYDGDDDELFDDDESLEREARERDELLGRFEASPEATPEHMAWAPALAEYAATYCGATIAGLTRADVDELLFDVFPRKVSVEPDEAPAIVASLRALLAFAARELRSETARAALASLARDTSQRLARALADDRRWGMAKSLVMGGDRAGFDMSSEAGIAAFMNAGGGRGAQLPVGRPSAGREDPRAAATKARAARDAKAAKTRAQAKRKQTRKARKKSRR